MARGNIYRTLLGKLEKKFSTLPEGAQLPAEQELADTFGVSKPTLRRALAELAERGMIVKQNGVGSTVARSSKVISRELVFLCHDVVFFAESLKSFSRTVADANYLPSIIPLSGDASGQERIIATAIARKPAGIVLYADPVHARLDAYRLLTECGIPVLFLIRTPEGLDGNLLTFENADGITGIVRQFYQEGRRRFALFGASAINPLAARERTLGFLAGLKKCRLLPQPDWICGPDRSPQERNAFFDLFRTPEKAPDAVCCLNDYCAGELIRQLKARGIDFSGLRISGFDHSPLTAFIPHALLTVEPPMEKLGREAAAMLIRQIENPAFGFTMRKLSSRLIETTPYQ